MCTPSTYRDQRTVSDRLGLGDCELARWVLGIEIESSAKVLLTSEPQKPV